MTNENFKTLAEKPEDPISLVVRYLGTVGIRIIDLFRMFDSDNDGLVSRREFIRGLKVDTFHVHLLTKYLNMEFWISDLLTFRLWYNPSDGSLMVMVKQKGFQ